MSAELNGYTSPRPSGIYRNAMEKRIVNLEETVEMLVQQVAELNEIRVAVATVSDTLVDDGA